MCATRGTALVGVLSLLVGCGGGGGSTDALCEAVRADRSTAAVFSRFDPSDADRALEQLGAARVTLGDLRDAAPDEVRDELDVEITYVLALIDGLARRKGIEPEQAVEVVRQVTAAHPGVADAAATLAAFSDKHCNAS